MSLMSANWWRELPFPASGRHFMSYSKEVLHICICSGAETFTLVTASFLSFHLQETLIFKHKRSLDYLAMKHKGVTVSSIWVEAVFNSEPIACLYKSPTSECSSLVLIYGERWDWRDCSHTFFTHRDEEFPRSRKVQVQWENTSQKITWRVLKGTCCQSMASTCICTYMYTSTHMCTDSYTQHRQTQR